MPTAEDLVRLYGLRPHPEGGFYVETYRATERVGGSRPHDRDLLPAHAPDLLDSPSAGERRGLPLLPGSDPVAMRELRPDGSGREVILGSSVLEGMLPQVIVPKGVWPGLRIRPSGRLALLGCTVAPGFDCADFEFGDRAAPLAGYPAFREGTLALTRSA